MKILLVLLYVSCSWALTLDEKIKLISQTYELESKKIIKKTFDLKTKKEIELGRIFFEEKILSGNNDMACINCHLDKFGSTDGLPIAVGVKGEGESKDRYFHGKGILVQRNALALHGRAEKDFKNFFWDGRIQSTDNFIISKFGKKISNKFKSPLSVASILPIMERDELIGKSNFFDNNKFSEAIGDKIYVDKYNILTELLKEKIYKNGNSKILVLLKELNISQQDFEIADIGNAIASFIEFKFPLERTRYDDFLDGNIESFSKNEKEGMLLFFGKGRCYSCHNGTFFTNFSFSSIGTPQGYFGPQSRHRDIGRANVTNRYEDFYKFRVPSLLKISKTAPYGHNGAFKNLEEVIVQHFNPLSFYLNNKDYLDADYFIIGSILSSREKILSTIELNNKEEIANLIKFLEML
jgi:cytochrome c peroxidase